jgi:carboxymethylenebutenolidase
MLKLLKRILIVIVALIGAGLLFLVGSVLIDTAVGAGRVAALTNTAIPGQNARPDVRAYVARPQGKGPFPAVIMIHEFYGLNESIVGKAEGLAQEGYLVIAPDTFRGSTTDWIPRAIYQVITHRSEEINQDLDAVFAWAAVQPEVNREKIAVMGFCYGGRASLVYSLHNPDLAATAVFYGSPETDPAVLKTLPGPVLGIFGGTDNSISTESVRAFEAGLKQAGIPNEITIYPGQPHAFVTDMQSIRAGGVQGQAWAQLLKFLDLNLKKGSAFHSAHPVVAYQDSIDWNYYFMLAYEHAVGTASHGH